ncbi:hypothetical protein B0H14DRAFT_2598839 [Mycena olivaceomarginata]|nr:hypothetical protein B0H14DRAFT_2598839 [Mycena olivaceomarginata]
MYSPCYEPFTPPERSTTPLLGPVTPPPQLGPSAVGSASFDIRQLLGSAKKDPPTPRKPSVIAASPSSPTEMQCGPPRTAARGKQAPRRGAPPVHPAPASLRDKKGQPMILIKLSQKSVTPPASEAYNEEGEEEKEDEEEEEEEDEVPPRPAKHRRTAPALPKSKTLGKSKGKGKAQVDTPVPMDTSSSFPIPMCKTRRKSKKAELPAYSFSPFSSTRDAPIASSATASVTTVPHTPSASTARRGACPTAATATAQSQSFSPFSLTRDAPIASSATTSVTTVPRAPSASTARRDACPTAATTLRLPITLVPPTISSRILGSQMSLITDLSAACADYELAREQLFRASARISVASNRVSTWIRGVMG